MKIAVDCMGGDFGVASTIPAIVQILSERADISIIAFGTIEKITKELEKLGKNPKSFNQRLDIRHTEQLIAMDESPQSALKNKRKSSMALAIDAVKRGEVLAAVSAGNTGALVAISRYMLKTLDGIDRPALITAIPTISKPVYMLDLGANVDCEVTNLVQFANMATIMVKAINVANEINPTVGVLNIGSEIIKGNLVVKETIAELQKSSLNFIGSIEGDEVFRGRADIVVCDGFVGNVALKITEGVSHLIKHWIDEECHKNIFRKIAALIALPIFKGIKHRKDPRIYNGATLIGLQGVVIKSHGGADAIAFRYAVEFAIRQIEQNVNNKISEQMKITKAAINVSKTAASMQETASTVSVN